MKQLEVASFAVALWKESPSLAVRMLRAWSRYGPRARAALPTWVGTRFLRDRKYVLRSDSGCLFAVEPTDFGTYLAMLRGGPNYPSHVFEVCRRHLDRHGVLYDVGANIGYVSMEIARSDLHDVRVFAFEPQSQLAEKLAISSHLNGVDSRLKVFDCLLGDEHGSEKEIFASPNSSHTSMVARTSGSTSILRDMATIDELVASGTIPPPTVVKIDVEGAELLVLRGARRVCSERRPYLVFEADENMQRFGYSKAQLFELVRQFGAYEFHDVYTDGKGGLGEIVRLHRAEDSRSDDILAVPPGGRVVQAP